MTTLSDVKNLKNNFNITQKQEDFFLYNVEGGKKFRYSLFLKIFEELEMTNTPDIKKDSEKKYLTAYTLEILQAYFLITDDIIDNSELRRGKKCWYKKENIGLRSLLDCSSLYCLCQKILIQNYNKEEFVQKYIILKLFNYSALQTWIGQLQDSLRREINEWDDVLKYYNLKYYKEIVEYKTCKYTVLLPLMLGYAYYLSISDPSVFKLENIKILKGLFENKEIYDLCSDIAYLMQIQDDYLNFFPQISGKSGTDIEEKKVTYFSCLLVSECISEDSRILFLKYLSNQKNDLELNNSIEKAILEMINLRYNKIEDDICCKIKEKAEKQDIPVRKTNEWILNQVYRRKK